MTTVLMPLDPTVSPQQAARVLSIRANLLPPEIRDGRRARRTRGFVLVSLVLVLALLGSWYWFAVRGLDQARTANDDAFAQLTDLQRAQQRDTAVQGLMKVENGTTLLTKELKTVLAEDLSWANMINLIRDEAAAQKVTIIEISGSLDDPASGAAATEGAVGTLSVSGTAKDKKAVAAYIDSLDEAEDISTPFVSTVSDDGDQVSFAMSLTITEEALCGRLVGDDHVCPSEGK